MAHILSSPPFINSPPLADKTIVLIIGGGIAAYKSLDLIRRLRSLGAKVEVILTKAAQHFITPLAAEALSGKAAHQTLFQRGETDISHINLARRADLIILAPATANRMAKIAHGLGDDLAGTVLLAALCPVLLAPAMNPAMWAHPATKRNVTQLHADGIHFIGPEIGEMAESNEAGLGRMSEPQSIAIAATEILTKDQSGISSKTATLLKDRHILVTSGPTYEPIDPIRYLANRSSGKQGHAIAKSLAKYGAHVTLISGPVALEDPEGVKVIHVETAQAMLEAVLNHLPAQAAIFAAAVADWRIETPARHKIKKQSTQDQTTLTLHKNPDILATIAQNDKRPDLVIGFAAETYDLIVHAQKKLQKKGADFILANNVACPVAGASIMGGDYNQIHLISAEGVEVWPPMTKEAIGDKIAQLLAARFSA